MVALLLLTAAFSRVHVAAASGPATIQDVCNNIIPPFNPQLDYVHAPTNTFCTGAVWHVGPAQQYTKLSQIASLVHDGDIIEIDAAKYSCDGISPQMKWFANNLTFIGVNGQPTLDETGCGEIGNQKGTINYYGKNLIIDNIAFTGDQGNQGNEAGIRFDGTGYVYITNSYFFNNLNGILFTPGAAGADLVIDHSVFNQNGGPVGPAHNMYISSSPYSHSFVIRFSYSHDAKVGHNVKSRAGVNYILYNRMSEDLGSASTNFATSYGLDLPQGGLSYVVGNTFEKSTEGCGARNCGALMEFGAEERTAPINPIQHVSVVGNTFVDNNTAKAYMVHLYNYASTTPLLKAFFADNLITGAGAIGLYDNPTNANAPALFAGQVSSSTTLLTKSPGFVDAANGVYLLAAGSPAIGAGTNPGSSTEGFNLTPAFQFAYPNVQYDASGFPQPQSPAARPQGSALDIGAFQYVAGQVVVPSPTVSFAAASTAVDYNTPATLTWSSTNASSCQAGGAWSGVQPTSGTYVTPALTYGQTYTITCTGPSGVTPTAQVVITVNDSAAAAKLGVYTWADVPNSTLKSVCGTGNACKFIGDYSGSAYVPDTSTWYTYGDPSTNAVFGFNFNTMKPSLVTSSTDLTTTKEYSATFKDVTFSTCAPALTLPSGAQVPPPQTTYNAWSWDPILKQIVLGPGGVVLNARGACGKIPPATSNGQSVTDSWSFNPNATTNAASGWTFQFGPEDAKFSNANAGGTWFIDPATGLGYASSPYNAAQHGGYLIDYTKTPPALTLVNNNYSDYAYDNNAQTAIDTTNHYAFLFGVSGSTAKIGVFNLNGLSTSAYGTAGKGGTNGTIGGTQPLFSPDKTWTVVGNTDIFAASSFGVTYNPNIQQFVAWTGGDQLYFIAPNYQTKTLTVVSKTVSGAPVRNNGRYGSPIAPTNGKFIYIPDKDVYLAYTGLDKDITLLCPSTSKTAPCNGYALPTPAPVTTTPAGSSSGNTGSTTFKVGQRVAVVSLLNVRGAASATGIVAGTEQKGALGVVTGGPTIAEGFTWWKVAYDDGISGWSVQDYLIASSAPAPVTSTNTGTNTTTSTTTSAKLPTAVLTVTPTTVTSGQPVTVTWSSTNAVSCTGTNFTATGTAGSVVVYPTATTTYGIVCAGGSSSTSNATVAVIAPQTTTTNPVSTSASTTVTTTPTNATSTSTTTPVVAPVSTYTPPAPVALPVVNGLVDFWQLAGTANDSVGTRPGTIQGGATFTTDSMTGTPVLQLDGATQYISTPIAKTYIQPPYTFNIWFKGSSLAGLKNKGLIAGGRAGACVKQPYLATNASGYLEALLGGCGPNTLGVLSSTPLNANTWYLASVSVSTNTASLYLNGVLQQTVATSSSLVSGVQGCYFFGAGQGGACAGPSPSSFFGGSITGVSLYSRILTPAEIQSIYTAGASALLKAPTAAAAITQTLAVGSTGDQVSALQSMLAAAGFYRADVSGYFGKLTQAAVKSFQAANGLAAVGSVGPQTQALLQQVSW